MHIKAVADLLGHSSVAITGDIYGHTTDDTARAAVDGLSGTRPVNAAILVARSVGVHTPGGYGLRRPMSRAKISL